MRAGKLRHQLTIEEKSVVRDAVGGETVTWVTFATVWGEARPLRGQEFVTMRAAQADITNRFVIRYLAGLNPAMRVQYNGSPHEIVEVIDVAGRNRELELLCRGAAQDA